MKAGITTSLLALRQALPPGMVARQYGNCVQIYALDPGPYPATTEQQSVNSAVDSAAAAWKSADPALRMAWNDFARRHVRLLRRPRRTKGPTGYHIYSQASVRRQMLGFAPELAAPMLLPPEPLTDLLLEPASANPREFRLTVLHRLTPGPDHVLLVRVTPATRGPARKPRREDARFTDGWSAASARELPPSGTTLVYPDAPFAVLPGRRFGVYARIVRVADGLASAELARDFVRF